MAHLLPRLVEPCPRTASFGQDPLERLLCSKMKTKTEVLTIIRQLRKELQKIYGSRLKEVYLFGSYARGDADDDSDIDVAVILDNVSSRFVEQRRCSEIQSEISLQHNCVIMLFFSETKELLRGEYAVFRTIAKEGIPA